MSPLRTLRPPLDDELATSLRSRGGRGARPPCRLLRYCKFRATPIRHPDAVGVVPPRPVEHAIRLAQLPYQADTSTSLSLAHRPIAILRFTGDDRGCRRNGIGR